MDRGNRGDLALRDHLQQKVRYEGGETKPRKTAPEGSPQKNRCRCTGPVQSDPHPAQSHPEEKDAGRENFLGAFIDTGRTAYPECRPGIFSVPLIFLLKLYKRFLSPLIPPCCRFHPTCSVYGMTAIRVHGPFKGSLLTAWRLFRCSPLFKGGYDPVPPKGSWRPDHQQKE